MDGDVAKKLRSAFKESMRMLLPEYTFNKKESIFYNRLIYHRHCTDVNVYLFVALATASHANSFIIECGWNIGNDKMPYSINSTPCIPSSDANGLFTTSSCYFRISHLWCKNEEWWKCGREVCLGDTEIGYDIAKLVQAKDEAVSDCLGIIDNLVADAFSKILKCLVPYYDDVINALRGSN